MAQNHALLTTKEAANILRCCQWTVYRYIRKRAKNKFPAKLVGGRYKMPRLALLKWAGLDEGDI